MGTWGIGLFENDAAADLIDEISDKGSDVHSVLVDSLAVDWRRANSTDLTVGIAAAALVAMARIGACPPDGVADVDIALRKVKSTPELETSAQRLFEFVLEDRSNELLETWAEVGRQDEFLTVVRHIASK